MIDYSASPLKNSGPRPDHTHNSTTAATDGPAHLGARVQHGLFDDSDLLADPTDLRPPADPYSRPDALAPIPGPYGPTCPIPGCGRAARRPGRIGLCRTHTYDRIAGRPWTPLPPLPAGHVPAHARCTWPTCPRPRHAGEHSPRLCPEHHDRTFHLAAWQAATVGYGRTG